MSVKVNPITGIFHRLKRAWGRLTDSAAPAPAVQSYADWMRHFEPDAAALTAQSEQAAQALTPLRFGFIYEGGDPADLQRLQRSLQAQTWPHWRLWCLQPALQPLGEPGPVQGVDYLARVSGGLELAPFALFAAAQAAASRPDALYADHDELVDGRRANPVFKPGWSPEMLLSSNYVQPLFWLRADLWERLQREVPGQVLEVELEQERERWIYEIKLLTPAGQLTKVMLDARTAEVLRVRSRESREDQPRSRDNR